MHEITDDNDDFLFKLTIPNKGVVIIDAMILDFIWVPYSMNNGMTMETWQPQAADAVRAAAREFPVNASDQELAACGCKVREASVKAGE